LSSTCSGPFFSGSAVAATTASLVDVGSGAQALVTLGAAQLSILLWAVSAWRYGIPTSESHALIAGLMGAGMSLDGFGAFNRGTSKGSGRNRNFMLWPVSPWAFCWRGCLSFCLPAHAANWQNRAFGAGQALGACLLAFAHGAQDGQKFMGIFFLALAAGRRVPLQRMRLW
jgi:PiT family inorganic phosphate transporter